MVRISSQKISFVYFLGKYVRHVPTAASAHKLYPNDMTTSAPPQNCIVLCTATFDYETWAMIECDSGWLLPREDIATLDVSLLSHSLHSYY